MSDLFDDGPAVEEFALPSDADRVARMREAAESAAPVAVAEPEAEVEAPAVETPDERLRNADGTFAAKQPADEPAAEETPAEKLLAGNFKSVDELERAYSDLRSLSGRQGQELGELRSAFEERFNALDERLAAPQAAPVQITADMIEQNPAYAAQLAYEQDNGVAFQQALEQWKLDDPFAAAVWVNNKSTEQALAERDAAREKEIAELRALAAPAAASVQSSQLAALIVPAAEKDPHLADFVASDRVAALAQEFPEEAEQLRAGTPEQKFRALTKLSYIDRGRLGDNLKVTQETVARETAEQAQQVREDAFVASSTSATSAAVPSKAEQIGAEWDAMDAPYNEGWNL